MKRIWLVRHGESRTQTREERGNLNPGLSEKGKRQSVRLVDVLKPIEVDCILVSPLKRAWQTFELARAEAARVEFDSRVIESDWGNWQMYKRLLPVETPPLALPDRQNAWLHGTEKRCTELMAELLRSEHDNFMLFGHWGVFSVLLGTFIGMYTQDRMIRAHMDNTGLSLLQVDEEGRRFIRFWNDSAHVKDLLE